MISLTTIRKSFGALRVLQGIDLQITSGERVSLIGAGGCGKTTVLKIIVGLTAPDVGAVEIMQTQQGSKNWSKVLKKIGVAFQRGGLFDFMTVEQNLLFAMHRMTNFDRQKMDEKVSFLLESVKLQRARDFFPHQLSGGMQRRVGIARALSIDPTIAIFDEPTSGLDPVTSTVILNMILSLCTNPQSVLLVATSNVETAIRFADRIVVINEGQVVADGSWRELLLSGSAWVRHFLSVRLVGLDIQAAKSLQLPDVFIKQHWQVS